VTERETDTDTGGPQSRRGGVVEVQTDPSAKRREDDAEQGAEAAAGDMGTVHAVSLELVG
jgi:hypothetical protein